MAAVLVSNETIKGMREFMNHMASTNLSMQYVLLFCCLKFDLTSRNDPHVIAIENDIEN